MKAISLWQPWAALWLSPAKVHETRHWPTRHRGPLLVHAAKHVTGVGEVTPALEEILARQADRLTHVRHIAFGALIGVVELVACRPTTDDEAETLEAHGQDLICGNWDIGRFAWRRSEEYRVFATPIPYVGRQGLFDIPDDVIRSAA